MAAMVAPALAAGPWEGSWTTEFGVMTLTQSGAQVSGAYTFDDGRIAGTATGNTLSGTWTEAPTRMGRDAGPFTFTLAPDGKSWTGQWGYTGEGLIRANWTGRCTAGACLTGATAPQGRLVTAQAFPGEVAVITGSNLRGAAVTIAGVPATAAGTDTRREAYVPVVPDGPAEVRLAGTPIGTLEVRTQPPVAPDPNAIIIPTDVRELYFDASLAVDPSTGATVGAGPVVRAQGERAFGGAGLFPFESTKALSVRWDFGDGTSSRQAVATHTYARPGTYNVKVSVSDGGSKTAVSTYRVSAPATSLPTVRESALTTSSTGAYRSYAGPPAFPVSRAVRRVTRPPVNISIPSQVVFNVGSATLRPESRRFLTRVSRIVRRATVPTRVAGYTDSSGPAAFNQALSTRRAVAVRRYLAQRARVRPTLLRAVGFGERYPLAPNTTEIGRQRNRRVVLTVRLPASIRRF
jgi:outer membrane protein OmpA-like peptidoglycan-associated protein